MQLEAGAIIEGRIAGIAKFGAFVALSDGKSGLVHISEIANGYVNDVHEHVQEGQIVKVKILSINEDGRINLSIKKAEEQPRANNRPRQGEYVPRKPQAQPQSSSFEDKLKQFMQESDSKMSGNRLYSDKKGGKGRRKG